MSESNFTKLSDESLIANFRSCKQWVDAAKQELQGVAPKAAALMKQLLEAAVHESVEAFQLVTDKVKSPAHEGLNPFDTKKWANVWAV